jgi:type IV pilus assembly protein PilA
MLQRLQRRLQGEREGGFTLIELMVVVLIIAILIAIAIPTFLGARTRAQNRAAQSNLRNALTAEKTHYTDAQVYTATASDLTAIEPTLSYQANGSMTGGTANQVFVHVPAGGNSVILGARSASGTCYYVRDVATTTTSETAGTYYANDTTCAAPGSTTVTGTRWT